MLEEENKKIATDTGNLDHRKQTGGENEKLKTPIRFSTANVAKRKKITTGGAKLDPRKQKKKKKGGPKKN